MRTKQDVVKNISGRKRVLLLLDFDGTLCPVTPRPEQANLTLAQKAVLQKLASGPWGLAIVSGRALPDLRRRVAIDRAIYCGNFGLEMQDSRWNFLHPKISSFRARISDLERELAALADGVPRVLIERKKWSLGFHYRNVPVEHLPRLRARWSRFRQREGLRGFRCLQGDRVKEILPDIAWGKGAATTLLWRKSKRPYLLAIGNDLADEDMFQAVRGKGIAVRVGRKNGSCAPYSLRGVKEVYDLLALLAAVEPK